GVAALVGAYPATRSVRQVKAGLAQTDPFLDLGDRARERQRLLVARAEQVEREPLSGAATDAGQLRQLGDQPLDGRGVNAQGNAPLHPEAGKPEVAKAAETAGQPAGDTA